MINVESGVVLSKYTSWQIGGAAEFFVLPKNIEELKEAQTWAQKKSLPITVVSGGTNILISDKGIRGLVVCLKEMNDVKVQESLSELRIHALAGASKSELLKIFLKYKLAPALFLAGIPGDVGGGVVMNAGVGETLIPKEFHEIVEWLNVLKPTGEIIKYLKQELKWEYRSSSGWQPGIICEIGFCWPRLEDPQVLEKVRALNQERAQKQPLEFPSCGSVFKNPSGAKAAQLIEQCGLKGYQVGRAQVSTKHANFIVNLGGATAKDVMQIIEDIKLRVLLKFSVDLESEVKILGE